LIENFADTFNGETISIPVPSGAPKEVPQIILHDSDKQLRLQIAESRTDFFARCDGGFSRDEFKKRSDLFMSVCEKYRECTQAKVGRIAMVSTRYAERKTPGFAIASHFCRDEFLKEPFNGPESFEIHSHKSYELDGFKVNSWVKCKSGLLVDGRKPVVLVEQDVNTSAEEVDSCDFSNDQIRKFLTLVPAEQDKILSKYFPPKDTQ
jgi:hypothetical protein